MNCNTSEKQCQASLAMLAELDKEFLTPKDIAPMLGCNPYAISLMAADPVKRSLLGFAVVRVGNRTKIPRIPFLRYMGWEGKIRGAVEDEDEEKEEEEVEGVCCTDS